MDITILCKVVDNFGDIGVVFRLAKKLQALGESNGLKLRIVCDNLKSFALLEPAIDEGRDFQIVRGWEIYRWDAEEVCFNAFQKKQPEIILECFQCGRPEWLDKLLFEVKVLEIVNIIMIDYLTAEDYAETFHKLKSLTRSARVQKVNFMPGFTEKTGGLLLPFENSQKKDSEYLQGEKSNGFNAVFFSYPRKWAPAVRALQRFNLEKLNGELNVMLAKGAGFESFKKAFEQTGNNGENVDSEKLFSLSELPFLPQEQWDALMRRTPLLFIRGEDSMAQACLCGVPFVWHAYPQSEEYQLVKVQALIDRMRRHFSADVFCFVENCWQIYNKTDAAPDELEAAVYDFLAHYDELKPGFADFSTSLLENGDLAENLMEFIEEMCK